jgi:histidine phosphotransferase ChpT
MPNLEACLRLMELACACVCHELAGPAGTTVNAIDAAAGDRRAGDEAFELASGASLETVSRLKYLRAAWGGDPEPLTLPDLLTLAGGLSSASRLTIDGKSLPPRTRFSSLQGRLLLNALMLAGDALPRGGTITLRGRPSDLIVTVAGIGAAWSPNLAKCLGTPSRNLAALADPRSVAAPVIVLLARRGGGHVSFLAVPPEGGPAPLRLMVD